MKKKLNGDNILYIKSIIEIQITKIFNFKSTLNNK